MDGVEELVGVTVIGATNRPEVLVSCPPDHPHSVARRPTVSHFENAPCQDPALMRPGRLDRILYVGPPDFAGRVDILRIRTRNMAVEPALDLGALATLVRSPPLPFLLKYHFTTFGCWDGWYRRSDARGQKSRLCAKRPH
jgi:SpoVK/Ycf46/Vps4 family AAA+-type ATPase